MKILISSLKLIITAVTVLLLTLLTQVGGFIFLISLLFYPWINMKVGKPFFRTLAKCGCFAILYLIATFLLIRVLAKSLGRVPLPIVQTNYVQPLTLWTALLNRNYVRPSLREATYTVARGMHKKFPGTIVNYLDAGFPFIDGFPLPPHLSHHDGKKTGHCLLLY